jgi:hypothetical protein
MRKWLIAAAILGILAVALAPHARRAWAERQLRAEQAESARYIALKEKEIGCLERLAASGLPKKMDVEAEIGRCRALSLDPATGAPAQQPRRRPF